MELTRTWVEDSADSTSVRLCAEICYEDRPGDPEIVWVAVPRRLRDDLTTTGNPWAVALLPLAATLGEPLVLRKAVDAVLLANLRRVLDIWRSWYPQLSVIPIEADADIDEPATPGRTVACFSGGVDSFFTLLRDRSATHEAPIDDLLTIWGFDVPLANTAAFERMRGALQRAADESGKQLVTVATNLRLTRWAATHWSGLAHGCGLASVALTLERRWKRVLIPATYDSAHLHPWGSHPLTDPLLSTSHTQVVHDSAEVNRVEKTRVIARSPLALRSLRVCWRGRSDSNCGACEKCYRTMTTLWLLGALEQCSTFPPGTFDPARIDRIFCKGHGAAAFMLEIRDLALTTGRRDVARSIERALARSRRLARAQAALVRINRALDRCGLHRPATWLLQRIEWRLLQDTLQ